MNRQKIVEYNWKKFCLRCIKLKEIWLKVKKAFISLQKFLWQNKSFKEKNNKKLFSS